MTFSCSTKIGGTTWDKYVCNRAERAGTVPSSSSTRFQYSKLETRFELGRSLIFKLELDSNKYSTLLNSARLDSGKRVKRSSRVVDWYSGSYVMARKWKDVEIGLGFFPTYILCRVGSKVTDAHGRKPKNCP